MKVLIQAGWSESLVFLTQLHALGKSYEIAKISFAVNHSEPVTSFRLKDQFLRAACESCRYVYTGCRE